MCRSWDRSCTIAHCITCAGRRVAANDSIDDIFCRPFFILYLLVYVAHGVLYALHYLVRLVTGRLFSGPLMLILQ